MRSYIRQIFTSLAAVAGVFLSLGLATAQEEEPACPQHRPGEGTYAVKAQEYVDRARKEENPQDRRGYFNFAIRRLKEGMEAEPNNPRYYMMAGQLSLDVGDYVAADTLWERAACLWQPYAMTIEGLRRVAWSETIQQANELLSGGDAAAATEIYRRAYTIYDREPHPIFQVANYYVRLAQTVEDDSLEQEYLDEACGAFRESLAATDRSEILSAEERREFIWAASTNLGQILALQGKLVESAEVYKSYLEEYPDDVEARARLAGSLARQGVQLRDSAALVEDTAQKESILTQAEALEQEVREQYDLLLGMSDVDLAADRYHEMAIGLYELGSYEQAAAAFERALAQEPYRAQSLEYLAHSLYQAERYDSLLVVTQKLVERYPNNIDFMALLAHAWRGTEQPERALEVLERREALPFRLSPITLQGGAVFGELENLNLEPGSKIVIDFTFYNNAGNVVDTGRLELPAPSKEEAVPFRLAAGEDTVGVTGFTYQVIEPV